MAKENLLTGLDGTRVMTASEAVERINACLHDYAPIGVKVMSTDGKVVRECPVQNGHRPAITYLNQALPHQLFTVMVTATVTT